MPMEAKICGECTVSTNSQASTRKRWVVSTKLRPLYHRYKSYSNCKGGWVSLGADLNCKENLLPPPGFDPRTVQLYQLQYPSRSSISIRSWRCTDYFVCLLLICQVDGTFGAENLVPCDFLTLTTRKCYTRVTDGLWVGKLFSEHHSSYDIVFQNGDSMKSPQSCTQLQSN